MALKTNELLTSAAGLGSQKRISPSENGLQTKRFENDAGAPTILAGSLVAYEAGAVNNWTSWDVAGANGAEIMAGVLWPDPITLHAADETLGTVLLLGIVHRDDIELNGQLQANIDAELKIRARSLGIVVQGLVQVR